MSIQTPAEHEERCRLLCRGFEACFGTSALTDFCDFRPHFDGHWLNFCRKILPLQSRQQTEEMVWELFQATTCWLATQRTQFHSEDVLQIIIGWEPGVLSSGEGQILKGGWKARDLPEDCHATGFIPHLQRDHPEWLRQGMLDAVVWP